MMRSPKFLFQNLFLLIFPACNIQFLISKLVGLSMNEFKRNKVKELSEESRDIKFIYTNKRDIYFRISCRKTKYYKPHSYFFFLNFHPKVPWDHQKYVRYISDSLRIL